MIPLLLALAMVVLRFLNMIYPKIKLLKSYLVMINMMFQELVFHEIEIGNLIILAMKEKNII